jgi:hypothetical protein
MTDDELEAAMDEGDSQAMAVMTLRDVFAASALTGLLGPQVTSEMFPLISEAAFQLADAMLRARVAK